MEQPDTPYPKPSLLLSEMARLLIPLMLLFSIFLLLRGHDAPGGGFNAGLVAAGGFILYAMAYSRKEARAALRVHPRLLAGGGLAMALLSGLIPLVLGDNFLKGKWLSLGLDSEVIPTPGTPVLFDLGVYFVVIGAVQMILMAIEEVFPSLFPDH